MLTVTLEFFFDPIEKDLSAYLYVITFSSVVFEICLKSTSKCADMYL